MSSLTPDFLARIAQRARDARRRYMMAAEDEGAVTLPVDEIERKLDEGLPGGTEAFRMMQERMKAMGFNMPTMSFVERSDGSMSTSSELPGAKPLPAPRPMPTGERSSKSPGGRYPTN